MSLFKELLAGAYRATFDVHYEPHWGEGVDKDVFYKIMEKWDEFFSSVDALESIKVTNTGEKVIVDEERGTTTPMYLCKCNDNFKFNYAYKKITKKKVDKEKFFYCLYYKFEKKDITFIMHFYVFYMSKEGMPCFKINLDSTILEKPVYVYFSTADSTASTFNIWNVMREIRLAELGEKIDSVTTKLEEIRNAPAEEARRRSQEKANKEFEERAKKRAEEKAVKKAEEKKRREEEARIKQEAEAKRRAEKAEFLSKLDEI